MTMAFTPLRYLEVSLITLAIVAGCGTSQSPGPRADGGGGTGGGTDAGAIKSYACGSDTCMTGQTFCYSFAGGTPGSGTSRSCMTLPAACAKTPTCACVCPPASGPSIECTFTGGFGFGSCSCSEANGEVTVSCAGA